MKVTAGTSESIEWGCATETLSGQTQSGDHCIIKTHSQGVLLGAIDGIGHGNEAAAASQYAVEILEAFPADSVISLVQRVHERLRSTRGVVMSLAAIHFIDHTLTWLGVGNVAGLIFRRDSKSKPGEESILLRGGVVGHQLPPLKAEVFPIAQGDLLILATDGVYSGFTMGINLEDSPPQIAERILKTYSKGNDDALVLVARYLGGGREEE
jgi:Serine phosphatase RsbU, regulator of sigma subunit